MRNHFGLVVTSLLAGAISAVPAAFADMSVPVPFEFGSPEGLSIQAISVIAATGLLVLWVSKRSAPAWSKRKLPILCGAALCVLVATLPVLVSILKPPKVPNFNPSRLRAAQSNVTAVKAARDIAEGSIIGADDLEEITISEAKCPESAIHSQSLAMGCFAGYNIAEGTVLLTGHLSHSDPTRHGQTKSKKKNK